MNTYLGVDAVTSAARALAHRLPGQCRLRSVGASRAGDSLWLLTVGRSVPSGRDVLVVAGPHACEPTGGNTILNLAEQVAREPDLRRDRVWHFLLCLDPDGTRLNESWFSQPWDLYAYFRGYYRPLPEFQPEWLPHEDAGPQPETAALLKVLDELRPAVQFSLHTKDMGGGWIQLTHELSRAGDAVVASAVRSQVPLEVAPADTVGLLEVDQATFLMPTDSRAGNPLGDWTRHTTWLHAARRYKTASCVVEAPMWALPSTQNRRPCPRPAITLRSLATQMNNRIDALAAHFSRARPHLAALSTDPVAQAAWSTMDICRATAAQWTRHADDADAARYAMSAGGAVSLSVVAHRLPLRAAALLCRALGRSGSSASALRYVVEDLLASWCHELMATLEPSWIPLTSQVAFQADLVVALVRAFDASSASCAEAQHSELDRATGYVR
ncbi:M14 family zinc carboxypeptidase [Streptomyces smaragdinus]|uniref:M14 family zinc carboxypeptidase n=1 Tax=Streptomyces smaragdinus TaxID=2585196 RepID=UPI002B1EE0EF|nr:M14 family zinc carboxypeptidase [Streptomyces smaragdinus]